MRCKVTKLARMTLPIFTALMSVMLWCSTVWAQDDDEGVVSLSTTITGNQEQPTVMYIIPWKQASDDSILYQPLKRQMNNLFGHVERPEHEREVEYLKLMSENPQNQ